MIQVLRNLTANDLATIRQWRNHPEINRYMFAQHKISEQEHLLWFEAVLQDPLKYLMVYEEEGDTKGFIQLEKKSDLSNVYEWGFYAAPEAVAGTGSRMTKAVLHKAFSEMGAIKIFAEVLGFNHPSIKLHRKLGFVQEGVLRRQHSIMGEYYDVYCFGLLKPEWFR